jgi:hypothetical protein
VATVPSRTHHAGLRLGWPLAIALLACNSDEKPGAETSETTSSTSDTDTTESGDETTDTGPPPDRTCRDAIACIIGCAAKYPTDPGPEDPELDDYFLACFLECGKDLEAEEALALIELVSCVSDKCYGEGQCIAPGGESAGTDTDSETGPTQDEKCQTCLGAGLLDIEPPGCIEEAAACI